MSFPRVCRNNSLEVHVVVLGPDGLIYITDKNLQAQNMIQDIQLIQKSLRYLLKWSSTTIFKYFVDYLLRSFVLSKISLF